MRRRQTAYLGLIVSALALGAFILLASMFKQDSFMQRDLAFTQRIHAGEESALAPVFDIVTDAGKSVLILVVLEVATLLWLRRHVGDLVFWVGTIAGGFALNLALRALLQGSRPYLEDTTIIQQNTGFPSGHAMMSLITYGLLIYGLRGRLTRHQWLLASSALLALVLLIGYSRMFFGFHYLSDVVGGYAAGLFWLSLCLSIHELLLRRVAQSVWKQLGANARRQSLRGLRAHCAHEPAETGLNPQRGDTDRCRSDNCQWRCPSWRSQRIRMTSRAGARAR